uniref:Glucose-methanol-choline oxidoreductase C-terminal domain-containing protein n=1 Tax=Bionectria ochroleuca TaxID=29856 RepID=A0A8H7TPH5_BIOOC
MHGALYLPDNVPLEKWRRHQAHAAEISAPQLLHLHHSRQRLGEVRRDPVTGRPLVDYTVSEFDQKHAEEGVVALTKILYVSGADEIQPYYPNLAPFARTMKTGAVEDTDAQERIEDPEKTDPAFAEWLRELRARGNKPPSGQWSAAHQMGSCRMGASPEEGVVDERGKVWGKEGLYVADSSVFPSASGVNPMITIQAIADWISRGVDKELRDEGSE